MATIVRSQLVETWDNTNVYLDDGTLVHESHRDNVYREVTTPVNEECLVDVMFSVTKSKEDEQLVSGWANVAVNADGSIPLDWQDDIIAPETLEKAAINFMLDFRDSGEMHKGKSKGTVVESIVFTKEKQAAIGIPEGVVPEGWFITVKVTDKEAFQKVKDGKYKMFSIQGKSKRIKI